jgi:YD repeat-containing protein
LRNTPETCNDSDEDCDGFIDEDFNVGASCSAGVGACNEPGAYVCNDSGNSTVCDAVPSEPRDETCNYADDDCDGTNDEGFLVGEVCSDGEGECRAEAIYECSGSGRGVTCSARATAPSAELCDGLDNDCDGSADESFEAGEPTLHTMSHFGFTRSSASTYAYDAEGRVATVERAFASEPGRFQTQSYTYDAEGNVTSVSVTDNGASAELASFDLTYTYDAEGMLEQVALEGDAAGRVSRYSYNAEGQLEEITYLETIPAELELGFALYSYNAEGQLSEVLTSGPINPMSDAEAEEELCMIYSYGELGVSAVSYDEGCDESVESVEVYLYDDEGVLTSTTRAGGAEGQLLMSTREQLDAEGELLYEALDEDGDGVTDMTYTYMYNEEGVLTLVMYDIDADGEADFDLHINYNEEGQHVSTESTPVGLTEPVIDRWSYSYDEAGRVTSESYDMNADDEIDSLSTYTYDAEGRLEVLRVEAGETWYEERYSYEAEATMPTSAVIEGDREETSASFVYEGDQLMSAEYTQGALLISRELHELGCWVEAP